MKMGAPSRTKVVLQHVTNKLYALALMLLTLPACAGAGGGGGPAATGANQPKLRFEGQTFKDSTLLIGLAQAQKSQPFLLEFERCTFTGTVVFTAARSEFGSFPFGAVFKDCTFEADLIADQTQFLGRLNFVKCRFKKRAQFNNCTFMAPAGFRTCAFDGDAAWNNSFFLREASFMESHFFDVARLQACRFMAPVQFGNAVFHKNADFSLARFDESAWFDYSVGKAAVDLGNARAMGKLSFRAAQVKRLLLTNLTAFETLNLEKLQAQDSVQTAGAVFHKGK